MWLSVTHQKHQGEAMKPTREVCKKKKVTSSDVQLPISFSVGDGLKCVAVIEKANAQKESRRCGVACSITHMVCPYQQELSAQGLISCGL